MSKNVFSKWVFVFFLFNAKYKMYHKIKSNYDLLISSGTVYAVGVAVLTNLFRGWAVYLNLLNTKVDCDI